MYVSLGRFEVIDSKMVIADALRVNYKINYDNKDPSIIIIKKVLDGYWRASSIVEKYGNWGYRNMELVMYNIEYLFDDEDEKEKWKYIGDIEIDSGLVAIYDYSMIIISELRFKINHQRISLMEDGIISQTAFGAGKYAIYILIDDQDMVIGIKIVFKDNDTANNIKKCDDNTITEKTCVVYEYDDTEFNTE